MAFPTMIFYVKQHGSERGPYTLPQLARMWVSGGITADSWYRADGDDAWSPIVDLADTLQAVESPHRHGPASLENAGDVAPAKVRMDAPNGLADSTPTSNWRLSTRPGALNRPIVEKIGRGLELAGVCVAYWLLAIGCVALAATLTKNSEPDTTVGLGAFAAIALCRRVVRQQSERLLAKQPTETRQLMFAGKAHAAATWRWALRLILCALPFSLGQQSARGATDILIAFATAGFLGYLFAVFLPFGVFRRSQILSHRNDADSTASVKSGPSRSYSLAWGGFFVLFTALTVLVFTPINPLVSREKRNTAPKAADTAEFVTTRRPPQSASTLPQPFADVQSGILPAFSLMPIVNRNLDELQHWTVEHFDEVTASGIKYLELADTISVFFNSERISISELNAAFQAHKIFEAAPVATKLGKIERPLKQWPYGAVASGTGFVVSKSGVIVTSWHVVAEARWLEIAYGTARVPARIIGKDEKHDIAVLKVDRTMRASVKVRSSAGLALGDAVFTIGFPNPELQGLSPKFSSGEICSTSGPRDDKRYFQVSVPVQPGNSGGALCDEAGRVVAVVSGKLDDRAAFEASGSIPQNVNYAIKSVHLLQLLRRLGVDAEESVPFWRSKPTPELARQRVQAATVCVLVQ